MVNNSLNRCPFCGGKNMNIVVVHNDYVPKDSDDNWQTMYEIVCQGCSVTTSRYESEAEVIESWNTRAEPDQCEISLPSDAYDDYMGWLTRMHDMADEWAKKNAQWPDSFDSGHYQAQRQAFTDARLRFQSTFKAGDISGSVQVLRSELLMLKSKARTALGNNLCPDHRDKQQGKPCLACTIERLESKLQRIDLEEVQKSYFKRGFEAGQKALKRETQPETPVITDDLIDDIVRAIESAPVLEAAIDIIRLFNAKTQPVRESGEDADALKEALAYMQGQTHFQHRHYVTITTLLKRLTA